MRSWTFFLTSFLVTAAMLLVLDHLAGMRAVNEGGDEWVEVSFADIEGWQDDALEEAMPALRRSCDRIVAVDAVRRKSKKAGYEPHALLEVCSKVGDLPESADAGAVRKFFEENFTAFRSPGSGPSGFVTGYYEPELSGSREKSDRFPVPVYRVPEDLVQLFPDSERAKRNHEMTAGRKVDGEVVPYYERKEIEEGVLDGRGLEILYLDDWADAFYMHIQGSGRVKLEEGGSVRLSYAAKNGHSYTAIGKHLIDRGAIAREDMSMQAVRDWLENNGQAARELMWENKSYIFFTELPENDAQLGPTGAQNVALTPYRSLAVDTSIHELGTPMFVEVPGLDGEGRDFRKLMIAQDAGSAIKGEERGDIFFGSGAAAGDIAGRTRHKARFTILLPKGETPGS